MNVKEKIIAMRKIYISLHGKEPKTLILGDSAYRNVIKELPARYVGVGCDIYGMTLLIDNDKLDRVEVCDLRT